MQTCSPRPRSGSAPSQADSISGIAVLLGICAAGLGGSNGLPFSEAALTGIFGFCVSFVALHALYAVRAGLVFFAKAGLMLMFCSVVVSVVAHALGAAWPAELMARWP